MKRFVFLLALVLFALPLFADAASAKKKLAREGKELTVDDFLKAIFMGETKLVGLYLEAGMPADAANEKGMSALHQAAREDDEKILAMLLKAGANVNVASESGETPLCEAADDGTPKHVDMLIKAGADVNAVCSFKNTALHLAAADRNLQMVNSLIAAGANVNARGNHGDTPLHVVADEDGGAPVVIALIKASADVNARNNSGETPLHQAVSSDRADAAKLLLEAGSNPNVKNSGGRSPLYEAVRFGRPNVVPVLLAGGANPNEKVDEGTLLKVAREEKNAAIIAALENAKTAVPVTAKPAVVAKTPAPVASGDPVAELKKLGIKTIDADTLFKRLEARDVRAVTLLIAAGVKPNVRDRMGRPPLWNAIEGKDVEMVKALLAAGADPNDAGKHVRPEFESGHTILMAAVDSGDPEIVAALLAGGAKTEATNSYGMNALMSVAMQGNAELAKLLIDAKANVNATDKSGTPVLYMGVAGKNPQVVKLMLEAGAKLGTSKKLITDAAAESGSDEIRALIGKAGGATVKAKEPAKLPTPKPASAKKAIGAQELYEKTLAAARKWQADAELVDISTLADADLDASGRSFNWAVTYYSRSAAKMIKYSFDDGKLTNFSDESNELRAIDPDGVIFDSKRLLDIADEAGGSAMSARNIRPSLGLVMNPRGPLWYFNYDDPETRKNVMTIVINANDGRVVLKDAK